MTPRAGHHGRRVVLAAVVLGATVAAWVTPVAAQQADGPSTTTTASSVPGPTTPPTTTPATTTTPASSQATTPPPAADGSPEAKLSPRLRILTEPSVQSRTAGQQSTAVGLPESGPASLMVRDGRVATDAIVTDTSPETQQAIIDAGGTIRSVSDQYATITVDVPAEQLTAVAAVPAVTAMREILTPRVFSVGRSRPGRVRTQVGCAGATTTEGDTQLKAALARTTYGLDGTGVIVGVLSDSYNKWGGAPTHAAQDVASGDLPGVGNPCGETSPVTMAGSGDNSPSGYDEGRAMLQIVHDLAPGAQLMFATAFISDTSFANNIIALKNAGAKVIIDDVGYFSEPRFQDGPIANAINTVTAAGVTYYSAAGNDNIVDAGNDVGAYEASAYRPTTCPSTLASYGEVDCHDFDPGGGTDNGWNFTLAANQNVLGELQWSEPWNGVTTDLDLFLLDASTNAVIEPPNGASQQSTTGVGSIPAELVGTTVKTAGARTMKLVIARHSGAGTPRVWLSFMGSRGISNVDLASGSDIQGPTIFGHSGTAGAVSMAAVPYNDSTTPETYSSKGPMTLYWDPVSGNTAASPLGSPQVLNKPDLAATDGGRTTFFAQQVSGVWRFYGTSAAAPHAGAVAALLLQKDPSLTPAQVLSTLQSNAATVANGTTDSVGAGLVDAKAALDSIASVGPMIATVRGGDGALYWQKITGATTTQWTGLGGGLSTRPIMTAGGGFAWVFVRGNDGTPYFRKYNGTTWTPYLGLGGFLKSDPIVSYNPTADRVFVAGVGGDNGIYFGTVNPSTNAWSGWTALGGAASANPALTPDGNGEIIVVRGGDGTPYTQRLTTGPNAGSGWVGLGGGMQGSPILVTEATGDVDLFIRGNDNALYRKRRVSGTWTGSWSSQGGSWSTSPTAVADATGVSVVASNFASTPFVIRYNNGGGSPTSTTNLAGATNADASIATDGTTSTIFIRGTDFGGYWRRGLPGSWPAPWQGTDGFLNSQPAIALSPS